MVEITVDGRKIEVEEGRSLLEGCLRNGIYIPNLCFMEGMEDPPASCRLCFVAVAGERKPVASCKVTPRSGMVVTTDSEEVRRLQRTALRLLLSAHTAECRKCPSNRRCELQRMVRFLGVRLRPRRYDHLDVSSTGTKSSIFAFVPSRCVLCGKCVHVCEKRGGYSLLTFARRGFDTVIASFEGGNEAAASCEVCLQCVEACPVSAILLLSKGEG